MVQTEERLAAYPAQMREEVADVIATDTAILARMPLPPFTDRDTLANAVADLYDRAVCELNRRTHLLSCSLTLTAFSPPHTVTQWLSDD